MNNSLYICKKEEYEKGRKIFIRFMPIAYLYANIS